jgi:hypothetical protein
MRRRCSPSALVARLPRPSHPLSPACPAAASTRASTGSPPNFTVRRHRRDRARTVILCMGRMANCYAGGSQERFPSTAVIATMRTGKNCRGSSAVRSASCATSSPTVTKPARILIALRRRPRTHQRHPQLARLFRLRRPVGVREQLRAATPGRHGQNHSCCFASRCFARRKTSAS